ncbi:MAG: HAD family hydrolase [Lutibacter sp.]|uniref:HAD family hydrolase n=1 Tax=Lutibacter sp. TaxID=1925666 RepID=UPI00385AACEC
MLNKVVIVFDLDDTLYNEIDYLKSAYIEIAINLIKLDAVKCSVLELYNEMLFLFQAKKNVFSNIIEKYSITAFTLNALIEQYREHKPNLILSPETKELLEYLKINNAEIGMITDGRSIQQRNKINALGIDKYLNHIIISEEIESEKPSTLNYQFFVDKYGKDSNFIYVGDNVKKDFITPNKLEWLTVCLNDNGFNIHSQNITISKEYLPKFRIDSLSLLKNIILENYIKKKF